MADSESLVLDSARLDSRFESKTLNLESKLLVDSEFALESCTWLAGHSRI